jgi:hypothetical protein
MPCLPAPRTGRSPARPVQVTATPTGPHDNRPVGDGCDHMYPLLRMNSPGPGHPGHSIWATSATRLAPETDSRDPPGSRPGRSGRRRRHHARVDCPFPEKRLAKLAGGGPATHGPGFGRICLGCRDCTRRKRAHVAVCQTGVARNCCEQKGEDWGHGTTPVLTGKLI